MQAEDGIRYLVRSRGLGDVYKRQASISTVANFRIKLIYMVDTLPRKETEDREMDYCIANDETNRLTPSRSGR